jgi:hypothetical protein
VPLVAGRSALALPVRGEGVNLLTGIYRLGDTRAVMIQGPSKKAIELVEVKWLALPPKCTTAKSLSSDSDGSKASARPAIGGQTHMLKANCAT